MTFDFLGPEDTAFYTLSFRIVRLKRNDSTSETLVTNLDRE